MAKLSVREKIVAAAAERFHALGYNACGVQEIVDAAGVPKGSSITTSRPKNCWRVKV